MFLLLTLLAEIIPPKIDYIEKTNYIVVVSADACPPCKMLEEEWIKTEKLKPMFTSVLLLENKDRKIFENINLEKQKATPTTIIYRYENGKMSVLAKQVGYTKESFTSFVERYKNEESKLEEITELPSLTEGIFGRKD